MGQQTSRIRRNNGSSSTTQTQTLKHGPNIQTQTLADHPYQSPNTTTNNNNNNNNNYNYNYDSGPWPLAPGPPPPYSYRCSSATAIGIQSPPTAHRSAISAACRDDGGTTKDRPKRRMRLLQDPLHPFLEQYELVFVVDDSTSMLSERWIEAEDVLAGVAQRCALHGPEDNNGIDVYFLNHRSRSTTTTTTTTEISTSTSATEITGAAANEEGYEVLDRPATEGEGGYTNVKTAEEVREIFGHVRPRGLTPFGNRIAQILDRYVRRVEDMMIARLSAGRGVYQHHQNYYYMDEKERTKNDVKPLYMIAITDGGFTDDVEKVLVEAARRLEGCRAAVGQVSVQFFQLGNDQKARQFLQVLEGGMTKKLGEGGMMPRRTIMVDMELGKGRLSADRILKSVLRAEKKHGHGHGHGP